MRFNSRKANLSIDGHNAALIFDVETGDEGNFYKPAFAGLSRLVAGHDVRTNLKQSTLRTEPLDSALGENSWTTGKISLQAYSFQLYIP